MVDVVKELVARDVEIIASLRTSRVLRENGIPVTDISSFASSMNDLSESLELLHPRVQGGVLGRWDDTEQKNELERLGIKRIDLVFVELPEAMTLERGESGYVESMGAVALLRSAASNPEFVITLCEQSDFAQVFQAMDQNEPLERDTLKNLAIKALQAVAGFDAALACSAGLEKGKSPDAWSIFAKRIPDVPLEQRGASAGLYRISGTEDLTELRCISGPSLDASAMVDLDLADAILEGVSDSSVVIVHHGTPCGFALVGPEGTSGAFELARSTDPRGAFGAVAGFNREVDGFCARSLSEAYLQAVFAPDYTPEARAELSTKKITVLKAIGGSSPSPIINSTRFGLAIKWQPEKPRTVSSGDILKSDDGLAHKQSKGLEMAWNIAINLPSVALVVCDEQHMLSCVSGQTSWREALRLTLVKLPANVQGAVAASAQPIRFAEEIVTLANAKVSAIRCVTGSPRQTEVLSKAQQLGVTLELVQVPE